jgi:hypothetical protein
MSISYDDAAIYALILRAKGKMMRLLGLFQQAGPFFETPLLKLNVNSTSDIQVS